MIGANFFLYLSMELLDQDFSELVDIQCSKQVSASNGTLVINDQASKVKSKSIEAIDLKKDPYAIAHHFLAITNNTDRFRKAVTNQLQADLGMCFLDVNMMLIVKLVLHFLEAVTGVSRGNLPTALWGQYALKHGVRMLNFPDDLRLRPYTPGRYSGKKPVPQLYWQLTAEPYQKVDGKPISFEKWTKGTSHFTDKICTNYGFS